MKLRKIDDRDRIALPPSILPDFRDGLAYFMYDAKNKSIALFSIKYLAGLSENICRTYGRSIADSKSRQVSRTVFGRIYSSPICANSRAVIPYEVRRRARFFPGDELAFVELTDRFVLRKKR